MKKIFVFITVLMMVGSGVLFAGGSQEKAVDVGSDGIQSLSPTVAVHCQSTTLDYEAMEYFCDLLKERSNGKIKPVLIGDGVLGDEASILEQVEVNTVEIATTGFSGLDKYIAKVNCWSVPYLFTSVDQVKASFEGKLGDAARSIFENKGIMYVGNTYRGNRQLTSNRLVRTPSDLRGLKLRLPDTAAWITVWQAMGTIPAPIASSEVFTALQTRVVDAQENPISSNYAKALWEVQDYVIMTNHIVDFLAVTWSKKFYDGLNVATQNLFDECMKDALTYMEKLTEENEELMIADMKARGMEFVEVDTSLFAQAAQPGVARVASQWEDWVLDEALKITREN
jgi:tripartite ATP-independent transporter DctP family solute receptor